MQKRNSRLLSLFLATIILGTGGALLLQAQNPVMPPMAVVFDEAVWLYGVKDSPEQVTATEGSAVLELAWSPDGQLLAYLIGGAELPRLWVSDRDNTTQTRLATDLDTPGLPLSFTADGDVLYATLSAAPPEIADDGTLVAAVDVFHVAPEREAEPRHLTTIRFETNCGGGLLLPTDARYDEEAGISGNGLILAATPYGLVHSTGCGGEGVALSDPASGDSVILDPALSRARLAPDGTRLAGISEGRLVVVDLATRMQRLIQTEAAPDQVAWGAPDANQLFYTTRRPTGEQVPLSDEQMQAFLAHSFFTEHAPTLPLYETAIHRVDLNAATDEVVFVQDGYAVGRLGALADGSALVFSRIPNLTDWALAVANGDISADDPSLLFDALNTELFRLDLRSLEVERLAEGLAKFTLSPF